MKQSWLAAQPAYALFDATDRLGVSWAERPHGMVQGDWDALLAFADKFLLGKKVERRFDQFPGEAAAPQVRESVPGAVATGSQHRTRSRSRGRNPVATAPGTDFAEAMK